MIFAIHPDRELLWNHPAEDWIDAVGIGDSKWPVQGRDNGRRVRPIPNLLL